MTAQIVWTCEKCGFPVEDNDGALHVDVRLALKARRDVQAAKDAHPDSAWSLGELMAQPGPVPWEVHHSACDPRPDSDDYWIAVSRARSHAQLLNWTAHLMGKTWLENTTWDDVIRTAAGGSM